MGVELRNEYLSIMRQQRELVNENIQIWSKLANATTEEWCAFYGIAVGQAIHLDQQAIFNIRIQRNNATFLDGVGLADCTVTGVNSEKGIIEIEIEGYPRFNVFPSTLEHLLFTEASC